MRLWGVKEGGAASEWGWTPGSYLAPMVRIFQLALGSQCPGGTRHAAVRALFRLNTASLRLKAASKWKGRKNLLCVKAGLGKKKRVRETTRGWSAQETFDFVFWLFCSLAERVPGASRHRVRPDHRIISSPPRGQSSAHSRHAILEPWRLLQSVEKSGEIKVRNGLCRRHSNGRWRGLPDSWPLPPSLQNTPPGLCHQGKATLSRNKGNLLNKGS